jgi:hypothetical protein
VVGESLKMKMGLKGEVEAFAGEPPHCFPNKVLRQARHPGFKRRSGRQAGIDKRGKVV